MSINLSNWTTARIPNNVNAMPGHVVTSEEWNATLNGLINQGNHSEETLAALIQAYQTLVGVDYATAEEYVLLNARVQALALGEISGYNHNDLANRSEAAAHPVASITGLSTALGVLDNKIDGVLEDTLAAIPSDLSDYTVYDPDEDTDRPLSELVRSLRDQLALVSGSSTAVNHNSLGDINNNAHTIGAITGLAAALASLEARIVLLELNKQDAILFTETDELPVGAVEGSIWLKHV